MTAPDRRSMVDDDAGQSAHDDRAGSLEHGGRRRRPVRAAQELAIELRTICA